MYVIVNIAILYKITFHIPLHHRSLHYTPYIANIVQHGFLI